MFHFFNFVLSVLLSAYAILFYDFYVTNPVDLISFFVYTSEVPPISYSYFILIKFLIIFAILFSYIDYFYPLIFCKVFKEKFNFSLQKCRALTSTGLYLFFFVFIVDQAVKLKSMFEKTDIYENMKTEFEAPEKSARKNVILIIVESMENTYGNERLFGRNLIPNISKMPVLGDYRQVIGTGNTASAMTGIFCGIPTAARLQALLLSKVTPSFEKLICLPDILKQNGYENYFYTSDTLSFANKDVFLKAHSFDGITGAETLIKTDEDKGFSLFGGAADSKLFEFAYKELSSGKRKKPFFMVLLTLNMHEPKGFLEKSCKKEDKGDFTDIVRCTDNQLSDFVKKVSALPDYKNTAVVIVGDHKARPNSVFSTLEKEKNRTLFNAVLNAPAPEKSRMFSPLDMGPTLLSVAGFGRRAKLGLGVSLYAEDANLLELSGPEKLDEELMKLSEKYNDLLTAK